MMQIQGLTAAYVTEGEIKGNHIVCWGEAPDGVKQAAVPTDKLIGISSRVPKTPGEHADVVRSGLYPVVYGDSVKRGDYLTTDAQGRAVKATDKQVYIGIAEEDGEADDLGSLFIAPGIFVA